MSDPVRGYHKSDNTRSCDPKRREKKLRTSLLQRLQAQNLPDATPPKGKIHPFRPMTITFDPLMHGVEI